MDRNLSLLEFQELETGPDGFRVELYTELLASYLLEGDICNAKFLWKRIPATLKQNAELVAVWGVAQKMWGRDMPGFYAAVRNFQWSQTIAPIINKLIDSKRDQLLRLIGIAYTSVHHEDVATLLGMTNEEAEGAVIGQGWGSVDGMLIPKEPQPVSVQPTSSEDQLGKLTDFVTVLEN